MHRFSSRLTNKRFVAFGAGIAALAVSVPAFAALSTTYKAGKWKDIDPSQPVLSQSSYARAGCPSGHVIGGGGEAEGTLTLLTGLAPAGKGGFAAGAATGFSARLRAAAVCAKRLTLDPLRYANGDSSGSALVKCKPGHHVVSGGFFQATASGGTVQSMGAIEPTDGGDSNSLPDDAWLAARTQAGATGQIIGTLSCAPGTVKVVQSSAAITINADELRVFTRRATCPSSRHVTGGGGSIERDPPDSSNRFGLITSSMPFDGPDRDKTRDDGWRIGVLTTDAGNATLSASAICR